jgi:hypothetical protein
VSDGVTAKGYSPRTNKVIEMPLPQVDAADSPQASAAMMREWVSKLLRTADVQLLGMDEVAGRSAYKLLATPKGTQESSAAGVTSAATIWVDSEHFYPLKVDMPVGGMRIGMLVREIEFNIPIPPERFALDVPAPVETVAAPVPALATMSAEEAAAKVGFPLLAADPAATEFKLESTYVTALPAMQGSSGDLVMQAYASPAGTIMVQQTSAAGDPPDPAAGMGDMGMGTTREVEVGGRKATLVSLGLAGAMITWQTDQTRVSLSGNVSEPDLLAFAESLH